MASDDASVCIIGHISAGTDVYRLAMRVERPDDAAKFRGEAVYTTCSSAAALAKAGAADGAFYRIDAHEFEEARAASAAGMVSARVGCLRHVHACVRACGWRVCSHHVACVPATRTDRLTL